MTESTQIKYNLQKANNTKHSRTKLPWFSCLSFMTLGQETRCTYSTMLPSPHGADSFMGFKHANSGYIMSELTEFTYRKIC